MRYINKSFRTPDFFRGGKTSDGILTVKYSIIREFKSQTYLRGRRAHEILSIGLI